MKVGASVLCKSGGPIRREAPEIFFFHAPPLFGFKSTISRFGERFRNGQYSLVNFLFAVLLLTVPPYPSICKSGGHVPPVHIWSRRHWERPLQPVIDNAVKQ